MGKQFTGKVDKNKMGKRRRDENRTSLRKKSTTDPDATMFYRPGQGSCLSYKAHFATDTNGFVTAVLASPSSLHDIGAVPYLVESHEKVLGTPAWLAADTKYGSEECLKYLQDMNIKTAVRPETKNNKPGYFSRDKFTYDSSKDCYTCPDGKILKRKSRNYTQNRINYKANKNDCQSCSKRGQCISGKGNFRIVSHYDSPCYQKAREWYKSEYGQTMQKLRKTIIEGIFGQAKTYHGMARSKFRGISKVEIQFLLTATALNLKKMIKILGIKDIKSRLSREAFGIIQTVKNIFRKLTLEYVILVS